MIYPQTVHHGEEWRPNLDTPRASMLSKTTKIQEYVKKKVPSNYLKQLKPEEEEMEEQEPSRKDKPLHGLFHQQVETGLKECTEALIMAAQ